jgi:hypothetical protein
MNIIYSFLCIEHTYDTSLHQISLQPDKFRSNVERKVTGINILKQKIKTLPVFNQRHKILYLHVDLFKIHNIILSSIQYHDSIPEALKDEMLGVMGSNPGQVIKFFFLSCSRHVTLHYTKNYYTRVSSAQYASAYYMTTVGSAWSQNDMHSQIDCGKLFFCDNGYPSPQKTHCSR